MRSRKTLGTSNTCRCRVVLNITWTRPRKVKTSAMSERPLLPAGGVSESPRSNMPATPAVVPGAVPYWRIRRPV
jgi:hypothetical protein